MDEDKIKLASMVEKLLYIVVIDEQIMKYKTERFKRRNEIAREALADVRGELKQSLQADIKKFLGKRSLTASTEITKAHDYEFGDETYQRIKKSLQPVFDK